MAANTKELKGTPEPSQFKPEDYTLEEILRPKKCALIIVDVQNDFCDPKGFFAQNLKSDISQMQAIVPHIQRLIDAAHINGVPVIFTKGSEDVKFRTGPGFRRAIKWEEKDGDGSVNSERGTFGWEFYQLQPQPEDTVLEKHKWSAFDGKDKDGKSLDEILKDKGVQTLVVTGVVTETCVYATVQEAFNRDYFVVVPQESVGSDKSDQHKTVLEHLEGFLGDVVANEVVEKNWTPKETRKSEVLVRPLQEDDIPALKVISEYWLRTDGVIAYDEVEGDMDTLRQSLDSDSGKTMFVAETKDGQVVGMMGLSANPKKDLLPFAKTDNPSELIVAYVHPEHRGGKGVGTALLDAAQDLAIKLDKKEILLESGPRHRDTAYAFYDNQPGFNRAGIIKDFYGEGLDTVVWQKTF